MLGLLLIALLGVVTLLYWWVKSCYSYWQSKGVVQPPTVFGFGHYKDAFLGREHPGLLIDKYYREFSKNDAVGLYTLLTPRLVVRNPDLIRQVMVSDFSSFHDNEFYVKEKLDPLFYKDPFVLRGDEWKPVRAKLTSFMTQARLKEVFPLMKEVTTRLEEYINTNLAQDFDAKELASLFTMDNVSSCVFGISSNCFTDPEAAFRKIGHLMMVDQLQVFWKTIILVYLPKIRDLIGLSFVPKTVSDYVENMILEVKNHRIKNNITRNDIMQHIISKSGENKSDLVGHAFTFFLEGFESSSMVASAALYELAMNAKCQEILHDEIKTVYRNSKDFDYDTLLDLPYLEKVIQESMRKHPIMHAMSRICTKNITLEIDKKCVELEKGTVVSVPVYSLHFDPQFYPNPEVFDPERFSEENMASRPPCTYMPLGEGPRICPGSRFGLTQVKLFVADLVLKYKLLRTDKTPVHLTPDKQSFMVVHIEKKWIRIEPRK